MQAATGGSATSPQVMEFLRECLKCPVVDAYGTTEVDPPNNCPQPVFVDWALFSYLRTDARRCDGRSDPFNRDCTIAGRARDGLPHDRPTAPARRFARRSCFYYHLVTTSWARFAISEICVRTPSMTPGYYRLPDHNPASFEVLLAQLSDRAALLRRPRLTNARPRL